MKSNKIISKLIVLTAILAVGASSALGAAFTVTSATFTKPYDGKTTATYGTLTTVAGNANGTIVFTYGTGQTITVDDGSGAGGGTANDYSTVSSATALTLNVTGATLASANVPAGNATVGISLTGLSFTGTLATGATPTHALSSATATLTSGGTITQIALTKAHLAAFTQPSPADRVYSAADKSASNALASGVALKSDFTWGGTTPPTVTVSVQSVDDAQVTTATAAGKYRLFVSITAATNFAATAQNADIELDEQLEITKKPLTLSAVQPAASVADKQYDGTNSASTVVTTVHFTGFEGTTLTGQGPANADNATGGQDEEDFLATSQTAYVISAATYGSAINANEGAASKYTITATVTLGTTGAAKNYSLGTGTSTTLTLTGREIKRKALSVVTTGTATAFSKVYDGSAAATFSSSDRSVTPSSQTAITFNFGSTNKVRLSGFINGEISPTVSLSEFAFSPTSAVLRASGGTTDNANVANGKDLNFGAVAINLTGSKGINYVLPANQTAGGVGTVTQKVLTIASTTTYSNTEYQNPPVVAFGNLVDVKTQGTNLVLSYSNPSTPTSEGTIVLSGLVGADQGVASAGDWTVAPAPTGTLSSGNAGRVGLNITTLSISGTKGGNYSIETLPKLVPDGATNGIGVTSITVKSATSTTGITKFADSLKITGQVSPNEADSTIAWSLVDTLGLATFNRVWDAKTNHFGIDTVWVFSTGKGNGDVFIRATSPTSGVVGEMKITISGQRTAPASFRSLTGLKKGTDNEGQAILSWTGTTAVSGTISSYRVSDGNRREIATSNTGHTLTGLTPGQKYTFKVSAVYTDGTEGPEATIRDSVPQVRSEILSNQIILNPATKTFNGSAQDLGRASLNDNTWTSDGRDLFDTSYTYVNDPSVSTTPVYTSGEPARFSLAKAPTNAGTYIVTATFENSRWKGVRQQRLVISPKALTNAMLTLQANLPTYSYDGEEKEPGYSVKDGTASLVLGVDYVAAVGNDPEKVWTNNKNAGTARVFVKGAGNYAATSTAEKTFNIGKRTIYVDTTSALNEEVVKDYDGRAEIDTSKTEVKAVFRNLVVGDALEYFEDYTVSNARFTGGANVSTATTNTVVNATITLTSSDAAKNYALASAPAFKTSGKINKKTPAVADGDTSFTFTIPTNHLYTGTARGIGAVTFKSPMTLNSATDTLTILYGDTTDLPIDRGTYAVRARVRAGANSNYESAIVDLGEYVIGNPLVPEIVDSLVKSADVRQGDVYRLTVSATSPNAGVLSYQWYRNDTLITGARSATYTVPTTSQGENQYYVWVTNTVRDVQVPDSIQSVTATVKVGPPARSLAGAKLDIGDKEYTYNGEAQTPDNISVTLGNETLTEGVDYVLELTQNTDAGRGLVKIKGIENYKDTAVTSFPIARKKLERDDFTFIDTRVYNAAAQPVVPFATADQETGAARTGLGRATILYNGAAAVPTDAGYYKISIAFARGVNFEASDSAFVEDSAYVISPKLPTASDLNYTIPENHVFNGQPRGIGAVTLKGEKGGDLTVLYYGLDSLPVEAGTYEVTVEVEGGENYLYNVVSLGSYTIADSTSSVASNDRVIPGSKGEQAVVAPVAVVAGEFTVGPNPVAKAAGKAGFFWQGKAIASGTLYVFSTSGNVVAKVKVADKGISADRREIGSWNLGSVAEGTYLVKGVLVGKDGGKVKVSSLVGVR